MSIRRREVAERIKLNRLAVDGLAGHAMLTAVDLGLFDALDVERPTGADEVARAAGTDPMATIRLLDALVAIDLLERHGDGYRLRPIAARALVSDADESMAGWLQLTRQWRRQLDDLDAAVRTGRPSRPAADHLGGSLDDTRRFADGMHRFASGPGRELAAHLDLTGRRRLLDVGAGPATYSLLLAEANPELECVAFDLRPVALIAEERIAESPVADRVSVAAGDYHADQLPRGFDVVLISNTLHQEDRASCLRILAEAHGSLEPGGLLVVQGMFPSDDRSGPVWPMVLDLLMLTMYEGGRAWTAGETMEMVDEAGFVGAAHRTMSMVNPASLVTAARP